MWFLNDLLRQKLIKMHYCAEGNCWPEVCSACCLVNMSVNVRVPPFEFWCIVTDPSLEETPVFNFEKKILSINIPRYIF